MSEENETVSLPNDEAKKAVLLPIVWQDWGMAAFANQVLVMAEGSLVHLGFYQVVPPMLTHQSEEERIETLKGMGHIEAKSVVHVILPVEKIDSLIEALRDQKNRWQNQSNE